MTGFAVRRPRLAVLCALLMVLALGACGGEDASTPDEAATPTSTREATPTPSMTSTTTPASATPTPTGAVLAIDTDTSWQELFDDFTAPEQACIRDALGEGLEAALGRLVLTDENTQESEVALFSCLSPATARGVLLYSVIAGFEETEGRPLSADETSCLHERVADVDVAAFIAGTFNGLDAAAEEFVFGLMGCFPDLFLSAFLAEAGMTLEELSEEEASCLREWSASADWQRFLDEDDETLLVWFLPGLAGCAPDLLLGFFLEASGITLDELSAEEKSCLREWLAGLDWEALLIDDESAAAAVVSAGLARCLPSEAEPGSWAGRGAFPEGALRGAGGPARRPPPGGGAGLGAGRGRILEGAVPAPVGVAIEGALDGFGEPDAYVFQAEEGVLYRVEVTVGTLVDSVLTLYDADGWELAYNDDLDHESSASRIEWEAPDAGPYYLAVESFLHPDHHGDPERRRPRRRH